MTASQQSSQADYATKAYKQVIKPGDLPVVSFRVVEDDDEEPSAFERRTKSDKVQLNLQLLKSFGYNVSEEDFTLDDHYIRHVEPIEVELANQVEYDMDEQDREWLDVANEERHKAGLDRMSYELFEIVMDKLEKEWFDLVKRIPAKNNNLSNEDSRCAVCDDGEGENSNAIVTGEPCGKLSAGAQVRASSLSLTLTTKDCIFCPNEGGAYKQTNKGAWAHLLCAIWIPEVGVSNSVYMEPIEGVETIPKSRWKLADRLDNLTNEGEQGFEKTNRLAGLSQREEYNVPASNDRTKSRKQKGSQNELLGTMSKSKGSIPFSLVGRGSGAAQATTKSARAHAKSYTSGPPLVPAIIVTKLLQYVQRVKLRRMREYVEKICRYWSLKREARRGAPLLKRLYLEPWTASNQSQEQTDAEKARRLEYLIKVRNDLERVRMLAELVRKREQEKLRQAQILKEFVRQAIFPLDAALKVAFEKIMHMDRSELFMHPVSRIEVPDYYDTVKHPMHWKAIEKKLAEHTYITVAEFLDDISLVMDNAMLYNPPGNPFHKLAARIKKASAPVCSSLIEEVRTLGAFSTTDTPQDMHLVASEASLLALREPGRKENTTLLDELFAYEFAPPPPPTPPPKPKRKIDKAEYLARKEAKAAKYNGPRIPGRSTRHTVALGIDQLLPTLTPAVSSGDVASELTPRGKRSRAQELRGDVSSDIAELDPTGGSRPTRGRGRSRLYSASTYISASFSNESAETGSSSVVPLTRPQRGVAGKESYSPLGPKERRARDKRMAMELVVDNLDSRDDFKRFNVGWVLPEGTKRGGRRDRQLEDLTDVVPSRRRTNQTTTSASSRSDIQFSQDASRAVSAGQRDLSVVDAKSRQSSPALSTTSTLSDLSELSDLPSVHQGEEEATKTAVPANDHQISRSSSMDPNAIDTATEKIRKRADESDSDYAGPSKSKRARLHLKDVPHSGKIKGGIERETVAKMVSPTDSELSILSRNGEDKHENAKHQEAPAALAEDELTDDAEPDEDEERDERLASLRGTNGTTAVGRWLDPYPDGTLVKGFPYYPAEVVNAELDYDEIGDRVWALKPKIAGNERVWLVRFYDKTKSYAWVTQGYLTNLGDDQDMDNAFLDGKDKSESGSFKNGSTKKAVRRAYEQAKAEMEV
ncbi:hypothetical protein QFC22_001118 [Naganishia vaughanmartiniae]|uniref:Uncharacterized protein n=1 Tax=Naganishia vaughanmartiniae TaxID=1424756 RepID=A0ACC2XKD4_9TREE|nr:hypothetical protein QFC22_001118 [Naganishia vaughanmartiniae]